MRPALVFAVTLAALAVLGVNGAKRCKECDFRNYDPVCGVDLFTYTDPCELRCNKVKLLHAGECTEQETDRRIYGE